MTMSLLTALVAIAWNPEPVVLDTNQDGLISREEFLIHRTEEMFQKDADGDNLLSKDEFKLAVGDRVPGMMRGRAFAMLDTDKDGFISREESLEGPARAFDEADKNKDGVLDADERSVLQQRMQKS